MDPGGKKITHDNWTGTLNTGQQKKTLDTSSVADPCFWLMDADGMRIRIRIRILDPDHAIFVIDLQDVNKKQFFFILFFLLITFWRYIYIIFQR